MRYADNLSAGAKLLYAEISSLTDARGYCFASNAYFCELYKISEDTVQRHLRALKKTGFIRIEDGDGGTGRRKIYAGANPLLDNPRKNAVVPDDPRKNAVETPANLQPPNNELNRKEEQDSPHKPPRGRRSECKKAPDYEPDLFARFWEAYPRGEDKQGAMRAWETLHPDRATFTVLMAALEHQKQSPDWLRGIGIPYACRWLKYRRWEDELRAAPPPDRTVEAPPGVAQW